MEAYYWFIVARETDVALQVHNIYLSPYLLSNVFLANVILSFQKVTREHN